MTNKDSPIGVFDSGIGGLTVLHQIIEALPKENTVYLGDTARAPYGTKSVETVLRYSYENSEFLVEKGVKVVVVACSKRWFGEKKKMSCKNYSRSSWHGKPSRGKSRLSNHAHSGWC